MANPRDTVAFDGLASPSDFNTYKIDNSTITYSSTAANGSAQVGLAVTLSADNTIQLVGDGEGVLGKLISVDNQNKAVVQTGGFMELPGGSGATLTRGKAIVGDLGASSAEGYIREVNTAVAAELGVARGFIQAPGTASATVVKL